MRQPVPAGLDGERADLVLARVAGVSRSTARRMVEEGSATFDGEVLEPRRRIAAGAVVEFEVPERDDTLTAEDVSFRVAYEDEFLAVVDKPVGVVVHPGAGRRRGTLAAGVLHRWPGVEGVGDPGRWGIVHRLDRDTSGLLVVALDRGAHSRLRRALAERRITREYLALVHGAGIPPTGTIDAPLGRDPRHPTRFRVAGDGRAARTHYRRLAAWEDGGFALLEVRLETGRTHQIRVHTASIGHPVGGDVAYGRRGDGLPRLCLHAARIRFDHPVTGAEVEVSSPMPADLAAVVARLGPPGLGEIPR